MESEPEAPMPFAGRRPTAEHPEFSRGCEKHPARSWAGGPGHAAGQPGHLAAPVVVEVTASTAWDPYLSLRALAAYSTLSERLLRSFLAAPDHPLPHFRVGGRVVIRRSDFDAWITVYRQPAEDQDADAIVSRLLSDLDDAEGRPHAAQRR